MRLLVLTNEEIDLVEEFKKMPLESRIQIIRSVTDLLKGLQSKTEDRPSREMIATMLSSTGHPEITRACYMASLAGVDWGWRELFITSK